MFYLGQSQHLESWAEGVTERKSLNNLGFVCLPFGRLSPGPRVFKESTLSFSYQKFALGKFSSHINASYKSSVCDSSKFPFIASFQPPYWWRVAQLFPFSVQCTVLHADLLTLAFSPNQSASSCAHCSLLLFGAGSCLFFYWSTGNIGGELGTCQALRSACHSEQERNGSYPEGAHILAGERQTWEDGHMTWLHVSYMPRSTQMWREEKVIDANYLKRLVWKGTAKEQHSSWDLNNKELAIWRIVNIKRIARTKTEGAGLFKDQDGSQCS